MLHKIGDRYRISDGERRYTALKELVDEGKIEPEVYCIIYEAPESELNDRLRLILGLGSNCLYIKRHTSVLCSSVFLKIS